jgi:hypothetical protein
MNRYALFFFAAVISGHTTSAFACSPIEPEPGYPTETASVTSLRPANNVPNNAIQLKVDVSNTTQIVQEMSEIGKVNLQVKQVLNGKFSGASIALNATNIDNCNSYFEPTGKDVYITVFTLKYSDGAPVLNRQGQQEFGSLFYKNTEYHGSKSNRAPELVEYTSTPNHSFSDYEKTKCLYEASFNALEPTVADWRKCVSRGEYVELNCEISKNGEWICEQEGVFRNRPLDLSRGYTFWGAYGATIAIMMAVFAMLVGIAFFARRAPAQ